MFRNALLNATATPTAWRPPATFVVAIHLRARLGAGTNGSFHNATGWPLWNTTRFPDVAGMNAAIHALGLKSDWYINNCICGEKAVRHFPAQIPPF